MTLMEFLLARIAGDEDRLVHEFDCDRFNVYGYGTRMGDCDCNATARLLAECAAKRRIVEWHDEQDDCCELRFGPIRLEEGPLEAGTDTFGDLPMRQSFAVQPYIGCVTLMILASVYADHPDYDPAWAA